MTTRVRFNITGEKPPYKDEGIIEFSSADAFVFVFLGQKPSSLRVNTKDGSVYQRYHSQVEFIDKDQFYSPEHV